MSSLSVMSGFKSTTAETTEERPSLPSTGEATGIALVIAGISILAGSLVMKKKFSK